MESDGTRVQRSEARVFGYDSGVTAVQQRITAAWIGRRQQLVADEAWLTKFLTPPGMGWDAERPRSREGTEPEKETDKPLFSKQIPISGATEQTTASARGTSSRDRISTGAAR